MSLRPIKKQKKAVRREHSSAEGDRQFDQATVDKLGEKYYFIKKGQDLELCCCRGIQKGTLSSCRLPGNGVYSSIWSMEEGTAIYPGEWSKPQPLAIQYAHFIQCDFICNARCDHHKNEMVRYDQKKHCREKKDYDEFNAECLEKGEYHLQKCRQCKQSGGKEGCGFNKSRTLTCKQCGTNLRGQETKRFKKIDKGCALGHKFCIHCQEEKKVHEFKMICVPTNNNNVAARKLIQHLICIDCSLKQKYKYVNSRWYKEKRLLMAKNSKFITDSP